MNHLKLINSTRIKIADIGIIIKKQKRKTKIKMIGNIKAIKAKIITIILTEGNIMVKIKTVMAMITITASKMTTIGNTMTTTKGKMITTGNIVITTGNIVTIIVNTMTTKKVKMVITS